MLAMASGTSAGSIAPSARVAEYTDRFQKFLDTDVASLEEQLSGRDAGTASHPHLDEAGRMHPEVWEARRESSAGPGSTTFTPPTSAVTTAAVVSAG